MEWLKEILKDVEGSDALVSEIKKGIGKNFVSKSDFNDKNVELKNLKEQLSDRDTKIEELKNSATNSEDLKAQIKKMQDDFKAKDDEYQANIKTIKLDNAIKLAINGKVHDEDIITSLFDREKLVLDDSGKVIGLEEQLESLKSSKSFLFKDEGKKDPDGGFAGNDPAGGQDPAGGGKPKSQWTYDDFVNAEE